MIIDLAPLATWLDLPQFHFWVAALLGSLACLIRKERIKAFFVINAFAFIVYSVALLIDQGAKAEAERQCVVSEAP